MHPTPEERQFALEPVRKPESRSAMTLIEIMIVVSIIGVLALTATLAIRKIIEKSRIAQAEQDLARLASAIEQLAWDTGKWPGGDRRTTQDEEVYDLSTPEAGLLTTNGSSSFGPKWKGPYIASIPVDPWGSKYFFDSDYYYERTNYSSSMKKIVAVASYGPNKTGSYDKDNIYVEVRSR